MKKQKIQVLSIALGMFFALIFFAHSTQAATYYVATNGNDSNPGTLAQPWGTIQKAANTMVAGDTCIVRDGTYTYAGTMNGYFVSITRSGTAAAPITFKAEHKWGAVLDGNHIAHSAIVIYGDYNSYITIQDFEVKNCRWGGIFTQNVDYPIHDITIYRNHIHDIGHDYEGYSACYGQSGIYTSPRSYNTAIVSNLIHDIGRPNSNIANVHNFAHDQGIYLCGYNQTVKNNIIYNCTHGWPISLSPDYDAGDGIGLVITNNTLADMNPYWECNGQIQISAVNRIRNCIISNNIFYQPRGSAIYWFRGTPTDVQVRNNLTTASAMGSVYENNPLPATIIHTNNIINADPKFVDAAVRNYHLQSSSSAIGAAWPADVPTPDFDGVTRPQGSASDIGALEYTGSTTTPKYKCSSGSCVRDDANGTFTDPNCANSCSAAPSCGDRTCNGTETCSSCPADCGACQTGNLVQNPSFESGTASWNFYTNGTASFAVESQAAKVAVTNPNTNTQLYQPNISLEPGTSYELSFTASSQNGSDMDTYIHQNVSPYTNYGLSQTADLTATPKTFTYTFQTSGFSSGVNDARLRFWLTRADQYTIDNISLKKAPVSYASSDINQDGRTDQTDFNILKSDFLKMTANLANPKSDIDQDGQVTIKDAGILMSAWK